MESKAISTVVGTLFFLVILTMFASGVMLYSLSENSRYEEAAAEMRQWDYLRAQEKLEFYFVYHITGIIDEIRLANRGGVPVTITHVWDLSSNTLYTSSPPKGWNGTSVTSIPFTLAPGEDILIDDRPRPGESYKVVTSRGNMASITVPWPFTLQRNYSLRIKVPVHAICVMKEMGKNNNM